MTFKLTKNTFTPALKKLAELPAKLQKLRQPVVRLAPSGAIFQRKHQVLKWIDKDGKMHSVETPDFRATPESHAIKNLHAQAESLIKAACNGH